MTVRHPAERIGATLRWVLLVVAAIVTAELSIAFAVLRKALPSGHRPSLQAFASFTTPDQLVRMKTMLGSTGLDALRQSMIVDMMYPLAYASLILLAASGAALLLRPTARRMATVASVSGWLITAGFIADHTENFLLWRQLDGTPPSWQIRATWVSNRLKWSLDLAALLATIACLAVWVFLKLRQRWSA